MKPVAANSSPSPSPSRSLSRRRSPDRRPPSTPSRRGFRLRVAVVALGAAAAVALPPAAVFAQRGEPILHEPLPASLAAGRSDRVVRRRPGRGLPEAIDTAGGRIDKPAAAKGGEPAPRYLPAPKPGTKPPPRIKADAQTGRQGTLHYRVVFNPSVAPFKRDLAFDEVTAAGELALSGADLRPIRPRGDRARPGHELFWGHVTLELSPGQKTPMPSVAPTSALLSVEATPSVPLTFWRDRAGNLSVSITKPVPGGRVDLRFVMDAPSRYFASPVGAGAVRDDPWTPRLAPALQAEMQALWPAVGVSSARSRKANLNALATWFRGFVPGAGPPPGQRLLRNLVTGRTGVCRHRSLGLVVLAHSLAIPAHYVMNDAHAFAEVWAPGIDGRGGWVRLDLGGGADELQLHAAKNKRLHQPLFHDPFPRPRAYANQTGGGGVPHSGAGSWAGAQRVKGAEQFSGMMPSADPRTPSAQPTAAGDAAAAASTSPPAGAVSAATSAAAGRDKRDWLRARARALAAPSTPPGALARTPGTTANVPQKQPSRDATSIQLAAAAQAWVGEVLRISGRLIGPVKGVVGQALEVWLVQPSDPTHGRQIGTAMTGQAGRFKATVAIPLDARLGVWDLVVRFSGNAALAPSFSADH